MPGDWPDVASYLVPLGGLLVKLLIELKAQDADGPGGEILESMGMTRTAGGTVFTKKIIVEEDDEVPDDAQGYARPYLESLLDEGVKPRRVQTQMRDTATILVAAVTGAVEAIEAARKAIAGR
jgi:hypothetical protein